MNSVQSGDGKIVITHSLPPTPVPGDYNGDGHVGFPDFFGLIDNWGKTNCGNPADFNGDCVVDFKDFFILIDHWGQ